MSTRLLLCVEQNAKKEMKKKATLSHPLTIKVTITTETRMGTCAGKIRSNVQCTCKKFRRDATCKESKLFQLLHQMYPPPSPVSQTQIVPWSDASSEIWNRIQERCISWKLCKKSTPESHAKIPITDPWIVRMYLKTFCPKSDVMIR